MMFFFTQFIIIVVILFVGIIRVIFVAIQNALAYWMTIT